MKTVTFSRLFSRILTRGISVNPNRLARRAQTVLTIETLECRIVPTGVTYDYVQMNTSGGAPDWTSSPSGGYTPDQIRTAYGISSISVNGVTGNGSGQTIAIVDPYDDPNLATDLGTFDSTFGTSSNQLNARSVSSFFKEVNQTGGTSLPANAPLTGPEAGWGVEESIDVEWAHAVAPEANILLVECTSSNPSDMFAGVQWAGEDSGASAVSMSWGKNEYYGEDYASDLQATGVTYVAAAGDDKSSSDDGPQYPAASPYVLAVGGTALLLNTNNTIANEIVWNDLDDPYNPPAATAGGLSTYEGDPTYQSAVQNVVGSSRGVPDVSFEAGANYVSGTTYFGEGVDICDSYDGTTADPWQPMGGTSVGTPCWAGLISIANQERNSVSLNNLSGMNQTLPYLYQMPESDFHDITSGSTTSTYGTYSAESGYDLASGRGSPNAPQLVLAMANNPTLFPSGGATATAFVGSDVNSFSIASNGYVYTDGITATESGSNTNFSGMIPLDPYTGNFSPGKTVAATNYYVTVDTTMVASVNTSGVIEYDLYNGTSWSGFTPVNSAADFTPGEQIAVVSDYSNDTIIVFAATTTGAIYTDTFNGTSWGSYSALVSAGGVADGAAVSAEASSSGNTFMVAAINSSGVIKYDYYNDGWSGLGTVNSAASFVAGKPVGLTELVTTNYFALYATTSTGAIDGITFSGSTWTSGYNTLASAGTFADGGAVTAELVNVSTSALELFAIAKTGVMKQDINSGSGWSGFESVGTATNFSPGASVAVLAYYWVPYSEADLFVFTDATNGEQNADYYNQIDTTWSGWFALGGGVIG